VGFDVTIEHRFNAMHQLRLGDGLLEPLHGHDWRVAVMVARGDRGLDDCGFVVDFHDLQKRLAALLEPLQHENLNELADFAEVNASAEQVAYWVAQNLTVPGEVGVVAVEVEESPGCVARWSRS
jgi:6-pyruvoyltetrahydropterin/6-carboxytetrahydropterin synthase